MEEVKDHDNHDNQMTNKELGLKILQEKTCFCFEGGGILGYVYAGAIIRLYELGGLNSISHAVGSSVGSIASIALACEATPYYIKKKILGMNLLRFEDGGNIFSRFFRLIFRYGSHKGKEIEKFVGEILEDLTGNKDLTFSQAYERFGTHLTVTYLSTRYKKTKYADHITTPDLKIKEVARWSSTIPLFFQASRRYNKHRDLLDTISDGGIADNYPIHILKDQGCDPIKILGFKLFNTGENKYDQPDQNKDYGNPKNVIQYVLRLVEILREQALRYHVHKEDWKLTCKIDVGEYQTTDFDISEEGKLWLYNSGVKAVDDHLAEIEDLLDKGEYPLN